MAEIQRTHSFRLGGSAIGAGLYLADRICLRQPRNGTARVRRFASRLEVECITPGKTVLGA
jgi:hypothetical protein